MSFSTCLKQREAKSKATAERVEKVGMQYQNLDGELDR